MNQFDDYLSYGVLLIGIIFFAVLAPKYMRYWKRLREAMSQSGTEWPPHSQEELNATARTDLPKFYKKGSRNMLAVAHAIFAMRTDNPAIQKPLRGIRRVLLAFIIFPIVFAAILVFVIALTQV